MNRMVQKPNLPQGKVTALAMGERYIPLFSAFFEKRGIELLPIPEASELDPRISSHADLNLLHLNAQVFAARGDAYIPLPVSCSSILRMRNNEGDSALNICIVGDYVICSEKSAAIVPNWLKHIAVKQRYARCSTCVVDEHSIITADPGIAAACTGALDVLQIEPGYIELPGFDYGFLGGCSFKLSAHELAFTGTLHAHPDERRILDFLSARSVEPVYLTDGPLLDIGSAVPVQEEFLK